MSLLRVLILADDPLARAGLAALLADQEDLLVTGQDAPEALADAAALFQPEAALWDLGPDPPSARSRLEHLSSDEISIPVVFLYPAGEDVRVPLPALPAGVGLVRRDARSRTLAAALHAAHAGLAVLTPAFLEDLAEQAGQAAAEPVRTGEAPTAREMDVLRLLAEGLPNKGIAQALGISENTVKFHVNAILSKLGAQSRTEAVTKAARAGWLVM